MPPIGAAVPNATGFSIRKMINTLRPLQVVTISLAGRQVTAEPELTDDVRYRFDALTR